MSIFEKIINREIPADIVFEDELCLAFRDIHPKAPVHILVIPKKVIKSLADVELSDQSLVGHLLIKCAEIAKSENITESGYRVLTNINNDGGQSVYHLHFHILGGEPLKHLC